MFSKTSIIVFMCFFAYALSQTYKEMTFTDCGSRNAKINRLSYTPMPIIQPGAGKISFSIAATENIKGVIKADVNIVRTVSGIKLPVRCYIVQGENVGSCSYPDLCNLMKRLVSYGPGNCPANLAQHGIDCNCPVNINKRDLDIDMDVTLPQAPEYASWLSTGDFDVKLSASVGTISACYNIKFSVKPAGKP